MTAIVTKFDPTLSTMFYSDYIGGSGVTLSWYMAVDASGNAFVTGATSSGDFPTVNNLGRTAPLTSCSLSKTSAFNCPDGFLFKLSADGSQLLFSELMGGSQASGGHALELNPVTNEVVLIGVTDSSDFQPAPTTLQTTFSGTNCTTVAIPCFETFLYGFDPATGAVRYGTFLGGVNNNFAAGLAVDGAGNLYVAGSTQPPFATALGPVTTTVAPASGATAGGTDIFVMKLNHSAQNVLTVNYITVIQGEADDAAASLAVDSSNNAYIVGSTDSFHLAVTPGVFQSTNTNVNGNDCHFDTPVMAPFLPNACGSVFVAKLTPTGALSFLTYLGGAGQDTGEAIALDSLGNIWLGGITSSTTGFPFSADAYPQTGAIFDLATPFLAEMSSDGTKVPFATTIASILGQVTSINTDANANIFITGFSSAVPTTPGVFPAVPNTFEPGFVQKWNVGAQPALQLSATNLTFPDTPMGGVSPSQTITVTNTGAGTMELGLQLQLQQGVFPGVVPSDFIETNNCAATLASNGSCTITVAFTPQAPSPLCLEEIGCDASARDAQILVTTNAPGSPATIPISGNSGNGALVSVSPAPIVFPAQAAGTSSAPMDISILNGGDIALTFSSLAITQAGGSDFTLATTSPDFKTCTTPTGPSIFCGVAITFSPAANATGTRTANLVLTDSAGGSPQSIQITGTVAGTNALNVSPGSIAIGPVAIGTSGTSSLKNITLSNPTTTAVTVNGLNITGDATDFSVSNGSCTSLPPFTVAGGASCFFSVIFGPAVGPSGLRTATLTVTSPQVANIPAIPLSAEAVSNTDPALTYFSVPSPLNLGTVPVGQSSNNSSAFLVIDNTAPIPCQGGGFNCGGPLTVTSITPGLGDYIVGAPQGAAYCTAPPFTIPVGNNGCTIPLLFAPTVAGPRNTSLVITSNDPQGPVAIPLSGTGVATGILEASPTNINFGNSQIGAVSPPQTVTFQNAGRAAINPGTMSASANFTVSANNCTTPIAPGGSCTVALTFTPPSAGPFTGTLTFTTDANYGGKQIIALSGSGANGALLLISPAAIQFDNQPVGTTSLPQTITLTSTGSTVVTFPASAIRVTTDFVISSTTCGASLAPGASCTVIVRYQPSPASFFFESGTVSFTDNAPGNPQSVALTGDTDATGSNATTATLVSSANPIAAGQPVAFTATVSSQNSQIPTGPVLFLDGVNTLASVSLDGTGHATFTTSALTPGSHPITAAFTGGPLFNSSTSSVVNQVISGTITPAATTTAVTSNNNPSTLAQSVTFTATVTSTTSGTPTGTVSFMDGTITLRAGTLNGSAMATLQTSLLAVGSHSITAVYGGDTNFAGSTSLVLTQVVNAASNPVPTINNISPASAAAGSGAFTLTVNGTNFVSGSFVTFNAASRTTTFVNSTQVTAAILATDVASVGSPVVTVTNPTPGGGQSTSVTFTITAATNPVPTVTSLSPNTIAAGSAGFTLTVNGTGFVSGALVNFGGAIKATTFVNSTQVTAAILATDVASVGTPAVFVNNPNPGGGPSNSLTFTITAANNPLPTITSISPNSLSAGSAGFTLTVTGSNFISNSVVQWNGSPRVTTFVNATTLTAAITAADILTANLDLVSVVNPTPGGGTSNAVTFTVTTPVPSLGSLVPNSAIAGTPAFTMTVNGGNFINTSEVQWNGANLTTTFVSATQLTATVPATDIASVGTASVTVFTPTIVFSGIGNARAQGAPSGTTSNALTFTINPVNPVPTLTALSPSSASAGSVGFTMTLTGTNFIASSVAHWNGAALATTFVSSTQLTAAVPASDLAFFGIASVDVINPTPGGGTSNTLTFTITTPVPVLASLSPSSATAAGPAFTLTLNGSNFISTSVAQWKGSTRTTTFVSATQLTAAITAADIATAGTASVTVFTPTEVAGGIGGAQPAGAPSGTTSNALTFTINADFSVTPTTTTETVTAGQSTNFTIATAPIGGSFPGTITFTASGLPAGATASFTPASVSAGTSTSMTVTTTARPTLGTKHVPFTPNSPARPLWLIAFAMMLALATLTLSKFGRRNMRRLIPIGALALLLISAAYLSGCNGGFPELSKNTGTPAGTYTITVTGTSGADVHSTTVTLVVQ